MFPIEVAIVALPNGARKTAKVLALQRRLKPSRTPASGRACAARDRRLRRCSRSTRAAVRRRRAVADQRDDIRGPRGGSAACRLAARKISILGSGSRLKPSTRTRSTGLSRRKSSASDGSGDPRNSRIESDPIGGSDHHLLRARGAMLVRILARLIEVEVVMGVLDRRNAQAPAVEFGDELDDQRRLARSAPSGKADYRAWPILAFGRSLAI